MSRLPSRRAAILAIVAATAARAQDFTTAPPNTLAAIVDDILQESRDRHLQEENAARQARIERELSAWRAETARMRADLDELEFARTRAARPW
jgi:Skp family chaperone for outer membrane proteins